MKYSLLAFLIILFSCSKSRTDTCPISSQYQVLTDGVKQWLPYTNNKSVVYENAAQVRDTIEIKNLFIGNDSIWLGDNCPITSGQFIRMTFFDKKSGDSIYMQVGYQDEVRMVTKYSNLLFYDNKLVLIEPAAYRRFDLNVTLNGKTFTQVLALECPPAGNCPAAGITKVYFSKSAGLVGYERNDVLWTLK